MSQLLTGSWCAIRHLPCLGNGPVFLGRGVIFLGVCRALHTSLSRQGAVRKAYAVDAVVEDVRAAIEKWPRRQGHVYVGTCQYSSVPDMERVVVTCMKGNPLRPASNLTALLSQETLFDGHLASEDLDSLEERLEKVSDCSLHLGEVDALRGNKALLAFRRAPDVAVFSLCMPGTEQNNELWQWIGCENDTLTVCRPDSSAQSPPEIFTIPMGSISDFQVRVEEVEWAFAELQVRLTSGEVKTLLRISLDAVMEELIDTESTGNAANAGGSSAGGVDGSGHAESKNTATVSSSQSSSEPGVDSIFDDAFTEDEIRKVDFAKGRVHPELAVVMSTEWIVKLAAQFCLACRQRKYAVGLRLPAVLRADENKWVELRNELWLSSRRTPVS